MKTRFFSFIISFFILFISSAFSTNLSFEEESTIVSWYGPGFHGRKTANGEIYNMNRLTAAHKTLRFGTKVKITNLENGKEVIVRINDRGPYVGKRKFDLSKAAFAKIADLDDGILKVKYQIL